MTSHSASYGMCRASICTSSAAGARTRARCSPTGCRSLPAIRSRPLPAQAREHEAVAAADLEEALRRREVAPQKVGHERVARPKPEALRLALGKRLQRRGIHPDALAGELRREQRKAVALLGAIAAGRARPRAALEARLAAQAAPHPSRGSATTSHVLP